MDTKQKTDNINIRRNDREVINLINRNNYILNGVHVFL